MSDRFVIDVTYDGMRFEVSQTFDADEDVHFDGYEDIKLDGRLIGHLLSEDVQGWIRTDANKALKRKLREMWEEGQLKEMPL